MVKEYQVTLVCATGKYKPVSCIIKKDTEEIKTIGKTDFVKSLKTKLFTFVYFDENILYNILNYVCFAPVLSPFR